jgi:D-alanyl-D-alanine carboxypeptidase/D-alanyl-D-alanine-endopeptidase (penicillin-binding protein 4)
MVCWALLALAEAPDRAPPPKKRPFDISEGVALAANARHSGQTAFIVFDQDTGTVLETLNPELPLPPASVAKLPTAMYALDRLGPEFRFETRVGFDRRSGDLWLIGGGDPTLDSDDLAVLAREAAVAAPGAMGLRVDDQAFMHTERIDDFQPDVAAYNPSVSGLNLNFNRVLMEWKRKSGGSSSGYEMIMDARAVRNSPPARTIEMRILERTPSGGVFDYQTTDPNGADPQEVWSVVRSALGKRGGRWLPVRHPGAYVGHAYRDLSDKVGLKLSPPHLGARWPGEEAAPVVATRESRPLWRIVRGMLKFSTNLTAEMIGLAAADAVGRAPGNLAQSGVLMSDWAGLQVRGVFAMANHSGLTDESRASVTALADLIRRADRTVYQREGSAFSLRQLLPQMSVREKGVRLPRYKSVIRVKTGTLNFVSTLVGFIEIKKTGKRLGFAILNADLDRRAKITDRNIEAPRGSKRYARRTRRFQRDLIRSWIARFGG